MGASASKPTETRIFTPKTQIDISQNLVNQLENSTETDYVRSQYTEKYLQDELAKRLDELSTKSNELFDKTLRSSVVTEDDTPDLTSSKLNSKIDELAKKINDKKEKFVQLNDEILDQKKEIVSCLIKNKNRPLNCWEEVKNFEKLVNNLK